MAINFPSTPAINDVHNDGDMSWKWDGSSWEAIIETSIPIPSQSGQAGEFLQTDGTTLSWEAVTHPTGLPSQTGQAGEYLKTDGTTATWEPAGGGYDVATTSTGYFDLPSGTDAQRPGSPATGMLRYNSDQTQLEHYADGGWIGFAGSTPTITSVTPTSSPIGGTTITVIGINFQSGTTVKLIGTDATQYNAASTTFVSSTEIQFSTPELPVSKEPYDVQLTLPNGGVAISTDILDAGGVPVWTTAAGLLGTVTDTATGTHFTLVATDPDGQAVTFSMDSTNTAYLALAGMTLNGTTGVISGDATDVVNPTTYNFDVMATDTTGVNITTRSFSIQIKHPYSGASGGTETTYSSGGTNYKVHTFTSTGTFDAGSGGANCDYLVVGGGGAGGGRHGGGAGAGGVIHVTGATLPGTTYTVIIGAGAARNDSDGQGVKGEDTTVFGETAMGGAAAGGYVGSCTAAKYDGGSGCGASGRNCNTSHGWDNHGAGISIQIDAVTTYGGTGTKYGRMGGTIVQAGNTNNHNGGGGGGAGADGQEASTGNGGGNGGDGIQIDIDNNNYYWAGGGGGNQYGDAGGTYPGNGGKGGGGGGGLGPTGAGYGQGGTDGISAGVNGGSYVCGNAGGAAGANTGGGGGGCAGNTCFHGGEGGSGIVIIRYEV